MDYTEKRLSIEEIEKAYPGAYKWAREFHDLYEETAPMFGYETRKETKEFDPTSPNGRLMAYVCFNLIHQALAEERARIVGEIERRAKDLLEAQSFEEKRISIENLALNSLRLFILDKPLNNKDI